jgi:hypothetical protein
MSEDKKKYEHKILAAMSCLKRGLIIDAYDTLKEIIEDMEK